MPPKKGKRKGGGTGTAPRTRQGTYVAEDAYLDVAADSGVSLNLFCGGAVRLDEMLGTTVNAVVPDFLQFIQGHFDQLNETKQHLRDIMREETGGTRAVPKTPARSDFRKVKTMVDKFNAFDLSAIKVELEEEEDESNSRDNLGSSRNRGRPFILDSDEDEEGSTNPERRGPAAARNIFEESDDDRDIPQSSTQFTATRASASLKANPSAKVKKNDSPHVSVPDLATPNMSDGARVKNEPLSAAAEAASSAPSPRRLRTRTPAAAHSPGRVFTATPSNASTRGRLDAHLDMDSEGDVDEIHPRNTRAQAQKASQKEKPKTRSQKEKAKPAAAAAQREKATPRKMTEHEKRVNKREEEEKKLQEQRRQKIEADLAAAEQNRKQEMHEKAERARREREEKQKRVQLKKEEQEKERREMLEKRQKREEMAEAIRERNRQNSPRRAASKSPARGFRAAGMNAPFSPQRCASKSPARTRSPGRATPSRGVQDGAASAGRSRPLLGSIFNNKRTAVPSSPATPKVPAKQSRFGQSPSLARNFFDETDSEKEDEKELRLAREKKREEEERERSRIRKMEAAELEKQRIIEAQKERERKEEERLKREAEKKEKARLEAERKAKEQKEKERKERALREKQENEREQRQREKEEIKAKEMKIVNKHLLNASMDENVTATSSYDMTPDKVFQPSSATNYNIDDLSSGDETDDENKPRKKVPLWARSEALQAACKVMRLANLDEDGLFGQTESPNLPTIFKSSGRYNKRTSSAKWDSPISNPSRGVSRYFAAIPPKK